jgi:hypothetical protein
MFRVSFNVDDRKLAEALRALAGVASSAPEAQPIANGKFEPITGGNGSTVERFASFLKGKEAVQAADVASWCKASGLASSSRGYVLKLAQRAGLLKKQGKGSHMTYKVVSK